MTCTLCCVGRLVSDFLCEDGSPLDYCTKVIKDGHSYNGFSLITADLRYKNVSPYVYTSKHIIRGSDPGGGVDGVASHHPFTCSLIQDAMGIGLAILASHPLQFSRLTYM